MIREAQSPAAMLVNTCLERAGSDWLAGFEGQLGSRTGTRLTDWLEQIRVPEAAFDGPALRAAGFVEVGRELWRHPHEWLPTITPGREGRFGIGLAVDSVEAFAAIHGYDAGAIEGSQGASLRRLVVDASAATDVWVVQRQGTVATMPEPDAAEFWVVDGWWRALQARPRFVDDPAPLMRLLEAAIRDLGSDRVAALFFAAERDYWMSRNLAGRVQKARQDALGLGWGNHRWHAYRSSREALGGLMAILDTLGLRSRTSHCDAARGVALQRLGNAACGVVVTVEVDLLPGEDDSVFARPRLAASPRPSAVGHWCALHGESLFTAGLHHLAIGADADGAAAQLAACGVGVQVESATGVAATGAEVWPVADSHVYRMLEAGWLDEPEAQALRRKGAEGSSLRLIGGFGAGLETA